MSEKQIFSDKLGESTTITHKLLPREMKAELAFCFTTFTKVPHSFSHIINFYSIHFTKAVSEVQKNSNISFLVQLSFLRCYALLGIKYKGELMDEFLSSGLRG